MDTSVSSTIADRVTSLSAKFDAIEEKLGALAESQSLHGEIQLEVVKLLQHIQMQQQVSLDQFGAITESLPNGEDAVSKKDFASLEALVTFEGQKRALETHVLKQSANLALRDATAGKMPIRCAFLVHSIPMWDALSDVYGAMLEDERFDPFVISLNSTPLGRGAYEGEDKVSAAFDAMGIPHLRFNMDDSYAALDILKALRPAVIFRQQQWDTPLPPAFHTPELTFARICVVPYGTNILSRFGGNSGPEISPLAFDQAYHRAAWRIFCETEMTQSYYRSFAHSDPSKFRLSGYPKLSSLVKCKGKGKWPLPEPKGKTYRVVWAPHYSLGKNGVGFGVFNLIFSDMIEWAREQKDIQFVLKPHPALFSSVLGAEQAAAFKKIWNAMPNCAIEEQLYGQLFDASDIMVTDGVSFLTEYHVFNKPLIFFDSGHHVPFNPLGKVAEACAHRVQTFAGLKKAVIAYKNGKSWDKEKEVSKLLDILIPNTDDPATTILNTIAADILNEGAKHNA
jgi:hypothetical protein